MFAELQAHTAALHSACVHLYTHITSVCGHSCGFTILQLLSVLSDTCQLSLGSSNPQFLQTLNLLQIHYRKLLSQNFWLYVAINNIPCMFHISILFSEILEPPENTTVFLDQTAVFRCEVTGGHASWEVNGKSTTEQTSIARDDLKVEFDDSENGNPLAILIIIARDEYNETTVQCVVNGGFSDQSQIVSLRIQGENCDTSFSVVPRVEEVVVKTP